MMRHFLFFRHVFMGLIKFLTNCRVYSQIWYYGWASYLTVSFFIALFIFRKFNRDL